MTLFGALMRRILLASVVCGAAGAITTFMFGRAILREAIHHVVAAIAVESFRDAEREVCLRAPASWSLLDGDGQPSYAYDATTLRSRNPAAPPFDRALLVEADARDAVAVRSPGLDGEGRYVFRVAREGECAVVQGRWMRKPFALSWDLAAVAAATTIPSVVLGLLLVVRPLAGRVDRLRRSVEHVGEASGFSPADALASQPDEIGVVAHALVRAHQRIRADAVRLSERQRALERHLADVAHDLRTPLASLQMSLERIALSTAGDAARKLVNAALRDTVYITGLSANLRLASRLEDGWDPASNEARVDLSEVVARVKERFGFLAERKSVDLEMATPEVALFARCAYVGAEQMLANLVENAIAYCDPGGHVAINLERRAEGGFLLEVLDDGPGVAPADLPRLGERSFRSATGTEREPRGMGLGLAIVGAICARCGFRLAFEAVEPRGLRVRIEGPEDRQRSLA